MGLKGRLGLALGEVLVSEGAVGFIHFPTTAHPVMQRALLSAGGRETGVMLAYLPAVELCARSGHAMLGPDVAVDTARLRGVADDQDVGVLGRAHEG